MFVIQGDHPSNLITFWPFLEKEIINRTKWAEMSTNSLTGNTRCKGSSGTQNMLRNRASEMKPETKSKQFETKAQTIPTNRGVY